MGQGAAFQFKFHQPRGALPRCATGGTGDVCDRQRCRREGFDDPLCEAIIIACPGIVRRVEGQGWDFERVGYLGGLSVLDKGLLPTRTVLCSNDRLAIGFLAACYERGVRVGHGVENGLRVASHDDHPYARSTCPALTTAAHDYEVVSRRAVESLFELIESGGSLGQRKETLVTPRLVLRASA